MKVSICASLLAVTVAAGCGSSGAAPTPDDFAQPGDENDITKSHGFTCTSDSTDSFDDLTVAGTGNAATITVKNDWGTYKAKLDPSYPNAKTTAANKDYRRFRWTADDPWQDSGSSVLLVHTDVLAGKAGSAKFQVTGEVFENNFMKCTPTPTK